MRMLTKKNATRAVVGLGAALALTACNGSFTGVGFMPSSGQTRGIGAFVNFRVLCTPDPTNNTPGTVTGSLTYRDSAQHVSLSAVATDVHPYYSSWAGNYGYDDGQCDGDLQQGHYEGTYLPASGPAGSGYFTFDIELGQPECGAKPQLTIGLYSGVYNGYTNEQCLTLGSVRPIR